MTDNMMSHDNWDHSVTKLHQTPQASPSLLEINQVQKEREEWWLSRFVSRTKTKQVKKYKIGPQNLSWLRDEKIKKYY